MLIFDNGDSGEPISAIFSIALFDGFTLTLLLSSDACEIGVVDGVKLGSTTRFCRPSVRGVGEIDVCSTQFESKTECMSLIWERRKNEYHQHLLGPTAICLATDEDDSDIIDAIAEPPDALALSTSEMSSISLISSFCSASALLSCVTTTAR